LREKTAALQHDNPVDIEAMSHQAQVNQSLYFARLQLEAADNAEQAQRARFGGQVQQCHSDAALEQLYRALYFLAQIVLANTSFEQQLRHNPFELNKTLKQAAVQNPARLLNQLAQLLVPGGELFELLQAYLSRWNSNTRSVGNQTDILHSDKPALLEQCRRWYELLSEFNVLIAEQNAEY